MDMKTTFLNGELKEEVYMTQPEGFTSLASCNEVCKLQRSIYGLKQASRSWNIHFNKTIEKFKFVKCEEEPSIYKKVNGKLLHLSSPPYKIISSTDFPGGIIGSTFSSGLMEQLIKIGPL